MEIPWVIIEETRAHPTHTWVGSVLNFERHGSCCSLWLQQVHVRLPTPNKSSLGKDDRSLVEVPLKHLGPGRSEEIGLEHHSSSINDFDIVRSDTGGELVHEENVGKPSHCNGIHGQPACYKLLQVFQPIMEFSIHSIATEKMMGVLKHCMTLMPSRGQKKEMVRMTGWNLMEEAKLLPPFDECLIPNHFLVMNIIAWNCRGPLKPSFQNHVWELVHNHDPTIMIIMETCIGGDRARDITGRLPFNGHPHKNYWFCWRSLDFMEFG